MYVQKTRLSLQRKLARLKNNKLLGDYMKKVIKITVFTAITILALSAQAQMTAKGGIDRLKANVEGSKLNVAETQKALSKADSNMQEVAKAKNQMESQKSEIKKAIQENDKYLQTLSKHETDLNKLITDEKKDKDAEAKKVQDLEATLLKLKQNQAKRDANLKSYDDQLKQIQTERTEWKKHGEELQKTQVRIEKETDTFTATTEKTYKEKQKLAKERADEWAKKAERNEKLHQQYVTISEIKE
jgi:chromosome segregation ATPase